MQKILVLKLVVTVFLGLLLLIPISMIESKLDERRDFERTAIDKVAESWTGEQSLLTPVIIFPYRIEHTNSQVEGLAKATKIREAVPLERYSGIVTADKVRGVVEVENKTLSKGVFDIPVYSSLLRLSGEYSFSKLRKEMRALEALYGFVGFDTPYIAVYLSDMRGISETPKMMLKQVNVMLQPSEGLMNNPGGLVFELPELLTQFQQEELETVDFSFELNLRGMESFSITALADETKFEMASNWPHPEFYGAALPIQRHISGDGFKASWQASRYLNNVSSQLYSCLNFDDCKNLSSSSFGVKFVQAVDVYLQSERSLKYAALFISLTFAAFFIFEQLTKVAIHPIQYGFVGFGLCVFYLLLVSLSEHIEFAAAYLLAACACVSILYAYAVFMLKSKWAALIFALSLVSLYGLLFAIVRSEDYALLMGSCLVFIVLTIAMLSTRNVDWYQIDVRG